MNTNHEYRVLIAEDELDTLHGLEYVLGRKGYQVYGASDGVKAAEKIRSESFDVVVSDLRMPKTDGMELLRMTKDKDQKTVFVMITAYGTTPIEDESKKLGAFDFINKPFTMENLIGSIEKGLEQKNGPAVMPAPQMTKPKTIKTLSLKTWLRSLWKEIRDLELDPALDVVVQQTYDAFSVQFAFEKRFSERVSRNFAAEGSYYFSHTEPPIPLYGEIYLAVESWGTLNQNEQIQMVQFLRRMIFGKLVPLR